MYTKTILASTALMAATAAATGSAVVVNACTYPIHLSAVPAAGGGFDNIDHTLQPKESWSQQWTELSNGQGWSIKLGPSQSMSNILQYEYTFHNDGKIWYDLSAVNGNPFDGNWMMSAAGDAACQPKHSWYRYDTDDAFGMQDCASDASVTVTLCSGEQQADELVSAVIGGASALPTVAATTAVVAPVVVPTTTSSEHHDAPATTATSEHHETAHTGGHAFGFNTIHDLNMAHETTQAPAAVVTSTPTTFMTQRTANVLNANMEIVTEVVTVVETAYAYETYVPGKRHVHHPEHPHFR